MQGFSPVAASPVASARQPLFLAGTHVSTSSGIETQSVKPAGSGLLGYYPLASAPLAALGSSTANLAGANAGITTASGSIYISAPLAGANINAPTGTGGLGSVWLLCCLPWWSI